ncbi:diguanylate cyclase [Quadrisphaera sp. KR29]|uniref:diguanylate cyclase n=1 Tax=Quadrisphaera sp. KR29 TaxID=3461391 RepID=UPI004043EF97
MHVGSQAHVRSLALVYALGGLLCLASAAAPLSPQTPVGLLRTLGLTGVAVAPLVLVLGRRWPLAVVHVALAALSGLVGLVAARSVTPVGVVGLGPVVIAASSCAAHALGAAAGRAHVLGLLAASSTGAALSPAGTPALPWLVVVLTAVAAYEVQGLLVRRLRAAAEADPLTGAANRRSWQQRTTQDLVRTRRRGQPLTVVIIDLDGFKDVNDSLGHAAGDALLQELAAAWQQQLRRGDLLGRHGGDEFVLSLPGAGAGEVSGLLARLRACHPMTWSAGAATSRGDLELPALLARADADLYAHKRARHRSAPRGAAADLRC